MGYNPTAAPPTKGQSEYDDREIPPGVYLMGPAWLSIPSPRSWKARFDVIMGSFEGAGAFILQGRDTSKQGTRNRLFYYSQSAGLVDVELETEGDGATITERAIRTHIIGRVIKAKVTKKKREHNGETYTDYDFQAFHSRDEWSARELETAAKWEAEFAEKREAESGGGGGDWGGSSSGGGSVGAPQHDDAPMPDGNGWGGGDDWG